MNNDLAPPSKNKALLASLKKLDTAITPELAANVVRDFILPMFENDGRKFIKKKNVKAFLKHDLGKSILLYT